jgi:protein-S-isoprenylcysteine O-methyltransferase Ste14
MDIWQPGLGAICFVLALTYGLQALQIFLLPVPSSFSTFSLVAGRLRGESDGGGLPIVRLVLLAACAIGSMLISLIPLVVCLAPGIAASFLPPFTGNAACRLLGCLLLLAGSGMSLAAVLTLRRGATFDAGGETETLITTGVFRLSRHPVMLGLGLIYLGFFLLLPSVVLAVGLLLFAVNGRFRMAFEEAELTRRFGPLYQDYAARVGRLGPRLGRRQIIIREDE